MKLYHGTTTKYLSRILKGGIKPRGATGNSNWEEFPSMDNRVYLSSTYPLYFAAAATDLDAKKAGMAVFEIESKGLDRDRLYPDEDFITQCITHNEGRPLKEVQKEVIAKMEGYQHHWNDSLEKMGNVSYHGAIPASAITRYATVDHRIRASLTSDSLNPTITIINHAIKGRYYQDFVKWVFGDRKTLPQLEEAKSFEALFRETGSEGRKQQEESVKFWKKESRNREGVEVFVM